MLFFLFQTRASGTKGGIKGETLDDDENSDEGDDEDYTVYECHGLAPVSCPPIGRIHCHATKNKSKTIQ